MRTLTEKEAEEFLEKKGFKIAKRAIVKSKEQLKNISIAFPIVMKASGKNINHKKKIGAVILNIKNIKEAESSFERLKAIQGFEEAMVQEMLFGEELILGIKKTQEFGQVIMLGKGGSNVEKDKDVVFRIPPLTEQEAESMIRDIKFYDILKNKKTNLLAVRENLVKISNLSQQEKIEELDINPLIVNDKEAKIVDARIIFD